MISRTLFAVLVQCAWMQSCKSSPPAPPPPAAERPAYDAQEFLRITCDVARSRFSHIEVKLIRLPELHYRPLKRGISHSIELSKTGVRSWDDRATYKDQAAFAKVVRGWRPLRPSPDFHIRASKDESALLLVDEQVSGDQLAATLRVVHAAEYPSVVFMVWGAKVPLLTAPDAEYAAKLAAQKTGDRVTDLGLMRREKEALLNACPGFKAAFDETNDPAEPTRANCFAMAKRLQEASTACGEAALARMLTIFHASFDDTPTPLEFTLDPAAKPVDVCGKSWSDIAKQLLEHPRDGLWLKGCAVAP